MMVESPFAMYTMGIGSLPIVVPVERNMAFALFHQRQIFVSSRFARSSLCTFDYEGSICEGDPVFRKAFYDPGVSSVVSYICGV